MSSYKKYSNRIINLVILCNFISRLDQHRVPGRERRKIGQDADINAPSNRGSVKPGNLSNNDSTCISDALLDLRGNIPSFIYVSDGKLHDVNVLDRMIPEPAAIYVMDRAYLDFERLFALHEAGAFFVTRAKSNADLRRVYSAPSDRAQGIICDQTVALSGFYSRKHYPHHLRRIRFKDPESEKTLIFLICKHCKPEWRGWRPQQPC